MLEGQQKPKRQEGYAKSRGETEGTCHTWGSQVGLRHSGKWLRVGGRLRSSGAQGGSGRPSLRGPGWQNLGRGGAETR